MTMEFNMPCMEHVRMIQSHIFDISKNVDIFAVKDLKKIKERH